MIAMAIMIVAFLVKLRINHKLLLKPSKKSIFSTLTLRQRVKIMKQTSSILVEHNKLKHSIFNSDKELTKVAHKTYLKSG